MKRYVLVLALLLPLSSLSVGPALSQFDYHSASVLPFYKRGNDKYFVLTRERWGRDKGTYDDSGGKRDKGEMHPVITAGRECWEEAILDKTIGFSLKQTLDYIDITKSKNTAYIIANTTRKGAKNVTYITDFTPYSRALVDNFYTALSQATKTENKEKDRIALVKWDDFKAAIVNQAGYNDPVYVPALVVNPKTKRKERENILLRPYLVIKLGGFFRDESYQTGKNHKIRFYTQMPTAQKARVAQKYDLKKLSRGVHALYELYGEQFTEHMFISTKHGNFIPASAYVEALVQEKNEIQKELDSSSFLHFFRKRKLKNKYNDIDKILAILYRYKGTHYY